MVREKTGHKFTWTHVDCLTDCLSVSRRNSWVVRLTSRKLEATWARTIWILSTCLENPQRKSSNKPFRSCSAEKAGPSCKHHTKKIQVSNFTVHAGKKTIKCSYYRSKAWKQKQGRKLNQSESVFAQPTNNIWYSPISGSIDGQKGKMIAKDE